MLTQNSERYDENEDKSQSMKKTVINPPHQKKKTPPTFVKWDKEPSCLKDCQFLRS